MIWFHRSRGFGGFARIGAVAVFAALMSGNHSPVNADSYPERPIQLVVPTGPGSSTDTIMRSLANDCNPQRLCGRLSEQGRGHRGARCRGLGVPIEHTGALSPNHDLRGQTASVQLSENANADVENGRPSRSRGQDRPFASTPLRTRRVPSAGISTVHTP